jgi:hypothetical protein
MYLQGHVQGGSLRPFDERLVSLSSARPFTAEKYSGGNGDRSPISGETIGSVGSCPWKYEAPRLVRRSRCDRGQTVSGWTLDPEQSGTLATYVLRTWQTHHLSAS